MQASVTRDPVRRLLRERPLAHRRRHAFNAIDGGARFGAPRAWSGYCYQGYGIPQSWVTENGIDPKYAGLTNPLPGSAGNIARGRQLYDQNCASCHGAQGLGDGPAARSLRPPPANLAGLRRMPMISDGYLDWTVAEGGVPVGSTMPPFKGTLQPNDIWKVMLFVQTL